MLRAQNDRNARNNGFREDDGDRRSDPKSSTDGEGSELHIDVVVLGLIYDIEMEGHHVDVTMSLTSPGCPCGWRNHSSGPRGD